MHCIYIYIYMYKYMYVKYNNHHSTYMYIDIINTEISVSLFNLI